MANTSALIIKLEGQAWIRNADGNLQPLRVGMRIPLDAEIVTAAGSQLSLQGDEKGGLQVAENQQLKLADDLFVAVEPSEAALATQADADVNTLIAALNQGQDPLEELDPTAATLTGGEGAGSTYVRLANVIERTTPLALQYPRSLGSSTNDFISGGVVVEEEDAPPPQAAITSDAQAVDEAGLESESTSEITNGQLSFSASDGIKSIKIGDVSFTLAQLQGDVSLLPSVDTGEGALRITGYTSGPSNQTGTVNYEYTLKSAQTHAPGDGSNTLQDPIEVTVTGNAGSTAVGSITITIVDDVPVAKSDAFTQATENAAVTGDVLANNGSGADVFGADGKGAGTGQVTLVANSLTGAGSLQLNPNGTFTYTPSQGEEGTVTFQYIIRDGDGDPAQATVTITLKADSVPTVTVTPSVGGDNSVLEAGLSAGSNPGNSKTATGTLDITTGSDSVGKLEIQGSGGLIDVTNGGTVQGAFGVLTVTKTGSVYSYSYTLTTATTDVANVTERDNFSVKVTDSDGDPGTATLAITIVDDVPVAKSDAFTQATENAAVTGDVLANNGSGADVFGADGKGAGTGQVTLVANSLTGAGSLQLNPNGTFTYTPSQGEEGTVTFQYIIRDGDGDPAQATVTITLNQTPVVNDINRSALESSRTEAKSNVVLTIDLSGSMAFESGVAGKTRLDLVKEAVAELLNSGSVNAVFITTFSSSGNATDNKALNGGQWYTAAQLQQAILDVNALTANGGTNYDGALTSVMNYVNAAGTFPAGAGKNVSVFMSDGEPVNGAVGTAKETAWINWLGSKNFSDAYAIGFGGLTATNANNLEPIAWKAGEVQGTNTTAAQDDHVILSDVTALKDALLQTVLSPGAVVTGDLKTEGGNTAGDGWGGAVVSVVTFGAQTHTFTSASDTFTFDLGAVGKVVVKGDGTYTFTANNTTDVNAALSAALTYTLKDVDGSVSNPASLVFTLTDRSEVSSVDDGASVSTTSTMVPVTVPNTSQANFNTNDTGDWSYSTAAQVSFTNLAVAAGGADAWLRSSNTAVSQSTGSDGRLTVTDNNGSSTGSGEVFTPIYTASSAGGEKLSFQVEARGNWSNGNDTAQWVLYQKVGTSWVALTGAGTSGFITSNSQPVETKALDAAGEYRIYLNVTDGSGGGSSSNSKASVSVDDFQVIHPVTYVPQWSTSSVSGNVLNNDSQGSEGASLYVGSTKVGVAGVDVVGTYGTLHLNADGSYTYTTASGAPYHATQQDVFEYHLTQADGDTATANLTITVNASGPGVLTGVVTETPVVPAPLPGHEILASTGLDTLVGTSSDDLFTWKSGAQSALVDVVKGFGTAGSDKLVLGDLLQGEEHTSDLSKFLHLETQAGTGGTVNTVIKVSTSGGLAADGSGYNQQIVVEGVNLTGASHDQNTMIKELIDQGKLKLDHG